MKNSLTLSAHLLSMRLQWLKLKASHSILMFHNKVLKSLISIEKGDFPDYIKKAIIIPAQWFYGRNDS